MLDPSLLEKSSGNIGYEIINDRRESRIKSPNRRSTPDSGRFLRSQEATSRERHEEPALTPINPIVPRVIKKRTKKSKASDSMLSSKNELEMEPFKVIF